MTASVLLSASVSTSISLAQAPAEENVYQDLTPNEAANLVTRLVGNQTLLDRLTPAMRTNLAAAPAFQTAIEHQEQTLLEKRSAGETLTLKRLVQNLYAPGSKVRARFDEMSDFGEKLEHTFATGNIEEFRKLESDTTLDPNERIIVDSQYLSFLHSRSSELIHSGQPLDALAILAEVPKEKRNQETWELARQAVSDLVSAHAIAKPEVLESAPVQAFLADLGEQDAGSRQAVVEILVAEVLEGAKAGKVAETRRYLALLRLYRPDPANDDLLRKIIIECTGAVQTEYMPELINELKSRGALTNEIKLRLVFRNYYGPIIPVLIFLSLLFPVIGLAAFGLVVMKKGMKGMKLPALPRIRFPRKEKILPGYMRPIEVTGDETEDEYTRLLRMFRLADSATEVQIKKAYRDKMKSLHPDRVQKDQTESTENSEEFRVLKHAYDRIFEIRKSWFSGRQGK